MKGIILKRESKLTWFHTWITGSTKLPISLCKYFWTLLFGGLLTLLFFQIPLLITLIIPKTRKNPEKMPMEGWWLVYIGIQGIIAIVGMAIKNWLALLIGVGCFIGGFVVIIGLVAVIIYCIDEAKMKGWIKEKEEKKKDKKPKAEWKTVFKEGKDAYFNKYCPKIDWK